jgi:FlaA1/EpsC-like NDP-sugar epimerase
VNNLIFKFSSLPRIIKSLIMCINDALLVICVLLIAFYLRLGYFYWPEGSQLVAFLLAPLIAIPIFYSFGLYRSIVRYIGSKALFTIIQAVTLYAGIWGLIDYMFVEIEGTPRSVILINWMLAIIAIGSSRIIAKWVFSFQSFYGVSNKKNIAIYGAGSAGNQLSELLKSSNEFSHIIYIDDDVSLKGSFIDNIPVIQLNEFRLSIEKYNISEIFLALPSISRSQRNKLFDNLAQFSINVRSLPKISDIADGRVKVDDLLQIEISDLLGREAVKPIKDLLKVKITNKIVLITGAGGSIGSELARQIFKLKPKKLILFEHSEYALYQIHQELIKHSELNVTIVPILGSVTSKVRLTEVFKTYSVQTVYHAAAYKHVPLVESNQSEGVLNNVFGTLIASKAAISANVETFVLISTDKAVRPTNTMGAAKRCSELILQALSKNSHNTCFTMVRFGNVLDSSGSVIPLFKKQIKQGGPITVTDKNIVRFFMTITEAVELVIQSGAMGQGGDVFVLDMGNPIKIHDLAKKMILLSGLKVLDSSNPNGDIEIKFTGLRPGEKLYEELLIDGNVTKTANKLIMRTEESMIEWVVLETLLSQLEDACLRNNLNNIREILLTLVPEFKPQAQILEFKA